MDIPLSTFPDKRDSSVGERRASPLFCTSPKKGVLSSARESLAQFSFEDFARRRNGQTLHDLHSAGDFVTG